MSEPPKWLRTDLMVLAVVAIVFAVAALSPRWRKGMTGAIGGAGAREDLAAGVDPSRRPSLDRLDAPSREIDPSKLERHGSPFDDVVTARAESLCVRMAESQLAFALKEEPVTVNVEDRYGTGNEDDGRGVYLIFEGIARTPSARLSAWRCTAKSLGTYPGMPTITHVEPR